MLPALPPEVLLKINMHWVMVGEASLPDDKAVTKTAKGRYVHSPVSIMRFGPVVLCTSSPPSSSSWVCCVIRQEELARDCASCDSHNPATAKRFLGLMVCCLSRALFSVDECFEQLLSTTHRFLITLKPEHKQDLFDSQRQRERRR